MTGSEGSDASRRWYQSVWLLAGAGYIFPPLGFYLMWRYQAWLDWLKATVTVVGSALAIAGSYISSAYVMPRVF